MSMKIKQGPAPTPEELEAITKARQEVLQQKREEFDEKMSVKAPHEDHVEVEAKTLAAKSLPPTKSDGSNAEYYRLPPAAETIYEVTDILFGEDKLLAAMFLTTYCMHDDECYLQGAFPYYVEELYHLIILADMNAQMGETFRALARFGRVEHSSKARDVKKIAFYIDAEIERISLFSRMDTMRLGPTPSKEYVSELYRLKGLSRQLVAKYA